MVLPSLARLSIERAAPTAAPSDAPSAVRCAVRRASAPQRRERLDASGPARTTNAAQRAALEVQSFITSGAHEIPTHVVGERVDREKAASAALDAFMDAGVRGVARALATSLSTMPWFKQQNEVDDAMVSLGWLLTGTLSIEIASFFGTLFTHRLKKTSCTRSS